MRLAKYLEKHGLSDAEFGARVGAHRTEVWNWKTGRRVPKAPNLVAIERATGGQVRPQDFTDDSKAA